MEYCIDQLRKRNRDLRARLDQASLDRASRKLGESICSLAEYANAERIATYFAVNGEISLEFVIDKALSQGKQIFLPSLAQKTLRFAPYFPRQKMRINWFKLPEPDVRDDEMLAGEGLDLVLVPLVAFDAKRNRIGMGGGFYDRSFAFRKDPANHTPVLIGVAHEFQKHEKLQPASWDVQLDMIVSDQAIYR